MNRLVRSADTRQVVEASCHAITLGVAASADHARRPSCAEPALSARTHVRYPQCMDTIRDATMSGTRRTLPRYDAPAHAAASQTEHRRPYVELPVSRRNEIGNNQSAAVRPDSALTTRSLPAESAHMKTRK